MRFSYGRVHATIVVLAMVTIRIPTVISHNFPWRERSVYIRRLRQELSIQGLNGA